MISSIPNQNSSLSAFQVYLSSFLKRLQELKTSGQYSPTKSTTRATIPTNLTTLTPSTFSQDLPSPSNESNYIEMGSTVHNGNNNMLNISTISHNETATTTTTLATAAAAATTTTTIANNPANQEEVNSDNNEQLTSDSNDNSANNELNNNTVNSDNVNRITRNIMDPRQRIIGSNTRRAIGGIWSNSLSPFFAALLCCANFYTICRFSLLTYFLKGPFLIEFILISIVFGLPFLILLMVTGQYLGSGFLSIWLISPIFKGIGVAFLFCYGVVSVYSVVPISWLLVYLRDSFLTTRDSAYKWTYCNRRFNGEKCLKAWNASSHANDYLGWSVSGYFHNTVLGQQDNGKYSTYALLNIILNLALIWILTFVLLFRGLHNSTRILIFLGTFPFILFGFIIIRFVEEFGQGITSLLIAPSDKPFLGDATSWLIASREAFLVWAFFGCIILSLYGHVRPTVSLIKHASFLFTITLILLISSSCFFASCMHIISTANLDYLFSSFEKVSTVNFVRESPGISYKPRIMVVSGSNLYVGESLVSQIDYKSSFSHYQVLRWATQVMPLALALKGSRSISSFWAMSFYLVGFLINLGTHLVLWGTLIESIISLAPETLRSSRTAILFIATITGFSVSVAINSWTNEHIIYFFDSCFGSLCWISCLYLLMILVIFVIRGKPCTPTDLVSNLTKNEKIISWLSPLVTLYWSLILPVILMIFSMVFTRSYRGIELSWFQVIFEYPFWPTKISVLWNALQPSPLYIVFIYAILRLLTIFFIDRGTPLICRLRNLFAPEITINEPEMPPYLILGASGLGLSHSGNGSDPPPAPDPPPKYSPPPSYSSATAKPLVKQFRSRFASSITIDLHFLRDSNKNGEVEGQK